MKKNIIKTAFIVILDCITGCLGSLLEFLNIMQEIEIEEEIEMKNKRNH